MRGGDRPCKSALGALAAENRCLRSLGLRFLRVCPVQIHRSTTSIHFKSWTRRERRRHVELNGGVGKAADTTPIQWSSLGQTQPSRLRAGASVCQSHGILMEEESMERVQTRVCHPEMRANNSHHEHMNKGKTNPG